MLDRNVSNMIKKLYLPLVFLWISGFAAAQSADVEVSIRFFDKEIYTPSSEVLVQVTVRNNSMRGQSFRLAENLVYNLEFDVRTTRGERLQPSPEFSNSRNTVQPVFYREVVIGTGQEYSFLVELGDFVAIEDAGVYSVGARFYPALNAITETRFIRSNDIILSVIPDFADIAAVEAQIDRETGRLLTQEPLPPDEVVRRTIQARIQNDWTRFFLYIDEEELFTDDPARAAVYRSLSAAEQDAALAEFREAIRNLNANVAIEDRPISFEILQTTYTPQEGTVQTRQRFEYEDFIEVREYTYSLEKRDEIWMIVDYTVRNIATEALPE